MADLHIHSTFSDGKLTIPELVDFYGSRGFGAIAITDHVCESGTLVGKAGIWLGRSVTRAKHLIYKEILKSETARAWERYKMVVIPGLEITKNSISNHRSAHILALGAADWISADGDIIDIIARIHAAGALAIAAHPVPTRKVEKQTYHLWDRRADLASHFDAWEVASGPHLFDEVLKSKLPKIASSDLHSPRQMTSWKTIFECERNAVAVLNAIRQQHLHFKFYEEKYPNDIMAPTFGRVGAPSAWYHHLGNLPFVPTIS